MKKIKQLGKIGFLALLLSFASCSSDSEGSSTGGPIAGLATEGTIKGDADGTTIVTSTGSTTGSSIVSGDYKTLQLTGVYSSTGDGGATIAEAFGITIYGYTNEGTYNVTNESTDVILSLNRSISKPGQDTLFEMWTARKSNSGTTGTIIITEATSTRVKGTFSFKGKSSGGLFKEVTNGSFNVAVTESMN